MKLPWKWIVISANLVGLLVLVFAYPGAMVSPGALVPAHAELAGDCFSCHAPFQGAAAERCVVCHAVADLGVLNTRGEPVVHAADDAVSVSFHQHLSEQDCSACHTEHGRARALRFSHGLLLPDAREDCASCHTAPTNDLHRDVGPTCVQCHDTEHWSPATFEHGKLPEATLARCESCHAAPTDRLHASMEAACTTCHTTERWSPSTFDHDRYFVLDRDHNASCVTCHSDNDFGRYTCFGCHEHTPANVRREHEEEGIRNFENCVACHRSADEEPGEGRERGPGGRAHEDDDD